jgi:hypothetical protein
MLCLWVNVTRFASSGRSRNQLRRNLEECTQNRIAHALDPKKDFQCGANVTFFCEIRGEAEEKIGHRA